MTRKQFDNKIRGFIWLYAVETEKRHKKIVLDEKYVRTSVIEFYAKNRYIPRLGASGYTLKMV